MIAYRPEFYPIILEQVTVERVRAHFRELVRGAITRYELPNNQSGLVVTSVE